MLFVTNLPLRDSNPWCQIWENKSGLTQRSVTQNEGILITPTKRVPHQIMILELGLGLNLRCQTQSLVPIDLRKSRRRSGGPWPKTFRTSTLDRMTFYRKKTLSGRCLKITLSTIPRRSWTWGLGKRSSLMKVASTRYSRMRILRLISENQRRAR